VANHSSAVKRNRQNQERGDRNRSIRTRVRSALKVARQAIEDKAENKDALVTTAIKELYRASSRNVYKKANASRMVSRLMKASA
jgi:small subunit ribosomal protein S20